jgi:hypothetical protein
MLEHGAYLVQYLDAVERALQGRRLQQVGMHDLAADTVQDRAASYITHSCANLVSLCIQSTHKVVAEMTGSAGD